MNCPYCGFLNSDQAQACTNCKRIWRQPDLELEKEKTWPESNIRGSTSSSAFPKGWPAASTTDTAGNQPGPGFQSTYSNPSGVTNDQYYSSEDSQSFDYQAKSENSKAGRSRLHGVARAGAWLVDVLMIGLIGLLIIGLPLLIWFFSLTGNYFQELMLACSFSGENNVGCLNTIGTILFTRQELGNLLGLLFLFGLVAVGFILFYIFGLAKRGKSVGQRLFAKQGSGQINQPSNYNVAWNDLLGGRLSGYKDKIMSLLGYKPKKL